MHLNVVIQCLFVASIENAMSTEMEPLLKCHNIKLLYFIYPLLLILLVMNPENIQLIQPPIIIMGKTLVRLLLSISVIIVGSVIMFCVCVLGRFCVRYPSSSLLKAYRRTKNALRGIYLQFSLKSRERKIN